jgi:plasmid stability protein
MGRRTELSRIDINDINGYDEIIWRRCLMGSITIRNLPDQSKESLRVQAAKSGISLEAYVRKILEEASGFESDKKINILELAQDYFGSQGGVDLELPKRGSHRSSGHFAS